MYKFTLKPVDHARAGQARPRKIEHLTALIEMADDMSVPWGYCPFCIMCKVPVHHGQTGPGGWTLPLVFKQLDKDNSGAASFAELCEFMSRKTLATVGKMVTRSVGAAYPASGKTRGTQVRSQWRWAQFCHRRRSGHCASTVQGSLLQPDDAGHIDVLWARSGAPR